MKPDKSDPKDGNAAPWAFFGEDELGEDKLQGNREGLIIIRDAINTALENGQCEISIEEIAASGVAFIPGPHPRSSSLTPAQDKVIEWGCITLFVAGVILIILILIRLVLLIF